MKLFYLVILMVLVASCTQMEIKPSSAEKIVKEPYIRTTEIDVEKEAQQVDNSPKIAIINPKDGEVLQDGNVVVTLNISNFKLVAPDRYPKESQGYIRVWLDAMEASGSKTKFSFENIANGTHAIKAELVLSNNTVIAYSKPIKVTIPEKIVPTQQDTKAQQNVLEFTIEADDHGFYPNTLKAKIGDTVKINFKFRDSSIYFAGLDVKGPFEDVKYKLHGEQPVTREFTMKGETIIKSFWPSTGIKKAELMVEII